MAMILGMTSPHPGFGSQIELSGRNAGGLLNLIGIGEALPSKRIASEKPPPAFLQVQPAGSFGNENVMEPGMLSHPEPSLSTVMAAEIVGDHEDVACWVVGFDVLKQSNVVRRVARSGASGQFLAIAHAHAP